MRLQLITDTFLPHAGGSRFYYYNLFKRVAESGDDVLILTPSAVRAEAMRQAASSFVIKPMRLPPGLFLFGVLPDGMDPLGLEFTNCEGTGTRLLVN